MKRVTKRQFKHLYLERGGGDATGWGLTYWNRFFQPERPGWRYLLEEPETPRHTRMMIVTDHARREYRLFFLTEEEAAAPQLVPEALLPIEATVPESGRSA